MNKVCGACGVFGEGKLHQDPSGFTCDGPYRQAGPPAKVPTRHAFLRVTKACLYCGRPQGTEAMCIGAYGPNLRRSAWKRALEKRKAKPSWLR